jgi:hypothetical protein
MKAACRAAATTSSVASRGSLRTSAVVAAPPVARTTAYGCCPLGMSSDALRAASINGGSSGVQTGNGRLRATSATTRGRPRTDAQPGLVPSSRFGAGRLWLRRGRGSNARVDARETSCAHGAIIAVVLGHGAGFRRARSSRRTSRASALTACCVFLRSCHDKFDGGRPLRAKAAEAFARGGGRTGGPGRTSGGASSPPPSAKRWTCPSARTERGTSGGTAGPRGALQARGILANR